MKNIILTLAFSISLFANEVQIFTSNTMQLALDKGTRIEKVFSGTKEEFYKNRVDILNSDLVKGAAMATLKAYGATATNVGSYNGGIEGGLIGLAASMLVIGGVKTYEYFVADNEYVLISIATNSKGLKTMLQTIVVSNSNIELSEAEVMANADQIKMIKD